MRTITILTATAFGLLLNAQDPSAIAGMSASRTGTQTSTLLSAPAAGNAAAATVIYNRAIDHLANGDMNAAIMDLDEVLVLQPRDAYALLGRADAYTKLGEKERALADLWNVLGIQARGPVAEQALLKLGQNAMNEGDPRSAEILFDRYVNIAPYDALSWCHRGIAKSALRQNDAALEDLDKAIDLDPQLDKAHVNKGLILLRMGFRQEGCASLQLAHDLGDLTTQEMLLIHCDR